MNLSQSITSSSFLKKCSSATFTGKISQTFLDNLCKKVLTTNGGDGLSYAIMNKSFILTRLVVKEEKEERQ